MASNFSGEDWAFLEGKQTFAGQTFLEQSAFRFEVKIYDYFEVFNLSRARNIEKF